MKCLSLRQPWASLLVHGKKRVETCGWELSHRGPLLIHAAKKWNAELESLCYTDPFEDALFDLKLFKSKDIVNDWNYLPFGAIVGRVNVTDCFPSEDVRFTGTADRRPAKCIERWHGATRFLLHVEPTERAFGDYSLGRFAFLCADFEAFETPIPYRGLQGLFDVPESVLRPLAS